MSAIYGFNTPREVDRDLYLKALNYWNKEYGSDGSGHEFFQEQGSLILMGSVSNHLCDDFPCGPSIIRYSSDYAVIDAVLYNREELGAELAISDMNMISDEELLLKWVKVKGYEGLKDVSGDFSGVVYSGKDHSFTLFRDHVGVRPLFYYLDDKLFAFSTDIRGLTAIPEVDTSLNEEMFFDKMVGYYELTPDRTEYQNIRCVIPAHYMTITVNDNGFAASQTEYWKLGSKKIRLKRDEDYAKEMCRLVTHAIERRAKAVTGMVGAELSGGLDSSVISIILNRTGHEASYYCWSFDTSVIPLRENDERRVVADICEQENITCHFRPKEKQHTVHDYNYGIAHFDVPYVNTLMLLEGASTLHEKGAKVILCGYGGDEGISHRPNLFELWYHHEYFAYFKALYRATEGKSLRLLRTLKRYIQYTREMKNYYLVPWDSKNPMSQYLNPVFLEEGRRKYSSKLFQFHYDPISYILSGGPRTRMDLSAFLGPEAGVQYMFPYLDYKVLDFAVSIPRRLYYDGTVNRLIYRQAFKHLMPKSLYDVNYKNMPSLFDPSNSTTEPDIEFKKDTFYKYLNEVKSMLREHMDSDYWAPYLDFEKIEHVGENPDLTIRECDEITDILNDLIYCVYLHNVGNNIKEYTREL